MTFTWGELRGEIRSNLLRDTVPDATTNEFKFSDEDLLVCLGWALDNFAQHTAVATSTSYAAPTDVRVSYTLPDNLYEPEPLEQNGFLYVERSDGTITYLDPVNYTDALNVFDSNGFYTYPDLTLTLCQVTAFGTSDRLVVRYFAYYTHPTADSDVISTPRWSREALSYLVAAHAISGFALKSANIRQWGAKPDTGRPEENPLRKQQDDFFCLAREALDRYPRQDRTNWWRKSESYGTQS